MRQPAEEYRGGGAPPPPGMIDTRIEAICATMVDFGIGGDRAF